MSYDEHKIMFQAHKNKIVIVMKTFLWFFLNIAFPVMHRTGVHIHIMDICKTICLLIKVNTVSIVSQNMAGVESQIAMSV